MENNSEFPQLEFLNVKGNNESLKAERAIIHYITTSDVDEMGDKVYPRGVNLSTFRGKVFENHNTLKDPIGKNINFKVANDYIKAKTVFSKSNPRAEDIYNLHLEGMLDEWSIGWLPSTDKKGQVLPDAIVWDRDKNIRHLKLIDLFEYSSVGLAMNKFATDQEKMLHIKSIIKSAEMINEINAFENNIKMENEIKSQPEFNELIELILKASDSMVMQTLIFDKQKFTKDQAIAWCKDHDMRYDKVDETDNSFRLRQRDPGDFEDGSFRTVSIADGIKVVMGKLKKSLEIMTEQEAGEIKKEISDLKDKLAISMQRNAEYKRYFTSGAFEPHKLDPRDINDMVLKSITKVMGMKYPIKH